MTVAARIPVGTGDSAYDVLIGRDLLPSLPDVVGVPRRVLLVQSPTVRPHATRVGKVLADAGHQVLDATVPDGEPAKTAEVLTDLWDLLGRHRFTRSDAVVAVGGGATTDLAGFAAATWLRGIDVVHVPTTMLAMVDAAIGGKTGIDTAAGKNLVGAFHPPRGVLCDVALLDGLPEREMVSGLAEVIKTGFISDRHILEAVEADPAAARDPRHQLVVDLVARSVRVKARVVTADLREHGGREVLNYGHTLGHAIERVEGYHWRHGEAISVGMVFAAELACLAGRLPIDIVDRHRDVLRAVGLPVTYHRNRWGEVRELMRVDKKARADTLRFVILEDVGRPVLFEGPAESLLEAAYGKVCT